MSGKVFLNWNRQITRHSTKRRSAWTLLLFSSLSYLTSVRRLNMTIMRPLEGEKRVFSSSGGLLIPNWK